MIKFVIKKIDYYKNRSIILNMEMKEILEKVGLNEKEAKVYLALLELGAASAYAIAPKAQLKRPITYIVLENLIQKGLVSRMPKVKQSLYRAEPPDKLIADIQKKEELLKRFMPNLQAIYNSREEKPEVQMFEGIEGVKEVYNKIFNSESVCFFGTSREILKIDSSAWYDFLRTAKERKLKVRDIVMQSPEDKKYIALVKTDPNYNDFYKIRNLPAGINIPVDSAIFGDSVVFFSFKPTIFSVIIKDKYVAQLMRIWYELAWMGVKLEE